MRRILRKDKKLDKSKEKQKQKELLSAINRDKEQQGVIKASIKELESSRKEVEKKYKSEEKEASKIAKQLLTLEQQKLQLEEEIIPLQSTKGILEQDIKDLEFKKGLIQQELVEEGKKADKELRRLDDLKNKHHQKLHNETIELEKKIAAKKAELEIKTKSEVQVAQSVADKKRENSQMDASIARRMEELAQINLDIAENKIQAERAQRDLDNLGEKLGSVKAEIARYDDEILEKSNLVKKAEEDALAKRNTVVQLVKREQRLNELIPAIRDLYAKAGIKIDI